MIRNLIFISLLICFGISISAQRPWQEITDPGITEIAGNFQSPPPEYGMILWWGWDGPMSDTIIKRDLDKIKAMGFRGVMIEAGYGMTAKYLSPEWFALVKIAVEQAKIRGLRVWAEDEGKYPSGFAGGKFSTERPDLKMQGLVITEKIDLKTGDKISRKLSSSTISAVAVNQIDNSCKLIDVSYGELNWQAPEGNWKIMLAGHRFKTSVTRSANNPTRGKDTTASLFDYLNPEATRQFLAWTHAQYKKYFGEEFGKTFMGLMGDEPDFAYTPWTPKMIEEFKNRKGYDVTPYLASFFVAHPTEEMKRAKADYWDVWSSLFSENFFTVQADWCRENNIQYIVHLNHEEIGPELVKSEGDYFKDMRNVGVPGVDCIWSQIWMDHVADYPKLASSAAHLFGKPRAFTESFAAFTHRPTVPQAKWVIDYQLVRGINFVQVMFMSASTRKPTGNASVARSSFFMSDTFPPVANYVNRATYLLSVGKPAAQIGLYFPTSSMWYGDNESNNSVLALAQQLMEQQRDFDFVDEQALSSLLKIENGTLKNLSGQTYKTIIIPSVSVISKASLEKLQAFATAGGKVIFMGNMPALMVEKTFLNASKPFQINGALLEPSGKLSSAVVNALPQPDVMLTPSCPAVKYLHRTFNDAELYFLFNESGETQLRKAVLAGKGTAEYWDAITGNRTPIVCDDGSSIIQFSLSFEPYETKIIVIKH